jgi:hypothetical protein
MRGDQPINDDPVSRERAEGADLISPHEKTIAFDVGCEDRRELSFDTWASKVWPLPIEYSPTRQEIARACKLQIPTKSPADSEMMSPGVPK